MNGLNGETAFLVKDVLVGKYDGRAVGESRNGHVTVTVRMEWLTRQDEYETIAHELVRRPLDFAIMTHRGADTAMFEHMVDYARGFDPARVQELARLAAYHLPSMKAGCVHQSGVNKAPCPVTGYRWGSAWLVEPLPDGFLERVKAVFADVRFKPGQRYDGPMA